MTKTKTEKGWQYSTAQVAKMANITERTLYRWLEQGAVPEPKNFFMYGDKRLRLWSPKEAQGVQTFVQNRGRSEYSGLRRVVEDWLRNRQNMIQAHAKGQTLSAQKLADTLGIKRSALYEVSRRQNRMLDPIPFQRSGKRKGIEFLWADVVRWLDKNSRARR